MRLLACWLGNYDTCFIHQPFVEAIDEIIQGISVIVIALFFIKRWYFIIRTMPRSLPSIYTMCKLGFVVESITVIFYFLFKYSGIQWFPVALGFAITALLLFSLRFINIRPHIWNLKSALCLGITQGLALLPGISRFGSTYTVARWFGIPSLKAFELSFLIEIPLNCAAFCKGFYWVYKHDVLIFFSMPCFLVLVSALCIAYIILFLVRLLIVYNMLWILAIYTGLLAIVFLFA
jgi:undecaprenyl-diphosphatase